MDISTFMSWFVSQVVNIFTYTFTTLNNITFGGTSLLKIIVFINIIVPFLYIIITIPAGAGSIGADKVKGIKTNISKYNYEVIAKNLDRHARANHEKDWELMGDWSNKIGT